jgi:hypothetical protein
MFIRTAPLLALATAIAAAGYSQPAQPRDWPLRVEPLATPAAPYTAQPQLSSSDRGIILSWVERDGERATLRFSERTAAGWSDATTVASGSDWFVNWADVPSVVRLANGALAAHWLQKSGGDTYAYDVRLSYSSDEGRTWAPPFTPHHDGTRTEHGFASLFELPGGGLGVAWLDGRATAGAAGHQTHGAAAAGAMAVRFAAFDRSWKQVADISVDTRVCDCCPTAAAVSEEGPIVAYRNRTEDETRDIHVSRFVDGRWTASAPVHADGWQIAACPVNGPMLSARGRTAAVAWFTGKNEQGRAYVAFSSDAGRTFGAPVRLDDAGALGRVDVELLPDGSALASWIEFTDARAQFRVRRVHPDGRRTPSVTVAGLEGNRASGYPRLAVRGSEATFAWTEASEAGSQVRTARASLP